MTARGTTLCTDKLNVSLGVGDAKSGAITTRMDLQIFSPQRLNRSVPIEVQSALSSPNIYKLPRQHRLRYLKRSYIQEDKKLQHTQPAAESLPASTVITTHMVRLRASRALRSTFASIATIQSQPCNHPSSHSFHPVNAC